jgi:hypothetical protein
MNAYRQSFVRAQRAPEAAAEYPVLREVGERISKSLLMLTCEGGAGNFMIVGAEDNCLQFSGRRGGTEVECEIAVGEVAGRKLDWLDGLGFTALAGGRLSRNFALTDDKCARELAQLAVLVMEAIYGLRPESRVQIKLVLE